MKRGHLPKTSFATPRLVRAVNVAGSHGMGDAGARIATEDARGVRGPPFAKEPAPCMCCAQKRCLLQADRKLIACMLVPGLRQHVLLHVAT